ncbi:hypothetical protein F66182_275 [Fusarium sp. NRRL 66182]|nr:hypothetical protein F66182_275 [Fusarium sp. NRRL 66182]
MRCFICAFLFILTFMGLSLALNDTVDDALETKTVDDLFASTNGSPGNSIIVVWKQSKKTGQTTTILEKSGISSSGSGRKASLSMRKNRAFSAGNDTVVPGYNITIAFKQEKGETLLNVGDIQHRVSTRPKATDDIICKEADEGHYSVVKCLMTENLLDKTATKGSHKLAKRCKPWPQPPPVPTLGEKPPQKWRGHVTMTSTNRCITSSNTDVSCGDSYGKSAGTSHTWNWGMSVIVDKLIPETPEVKTANIGFIFNQGYAVTLDKSVSSDYSCNIKSNNSICVKNAQNYQALYVTYMDFIPFYQWIRLPMASDVHNFWYCGLNLACKGKEQTQWEFLGEGVWPQDYDNVGSMSEDMSGRPNPQQPPQQMQSQQPPQQMQYQQKPPQHVQYQQKPPQQMQSQYVQSQYIPAQQKPPQQKPPQHKPPQQMRHVGYP